MKEVCQKVEESREALKSLLQRMERLENDCIARVIEYPAEFGEPSTNFPGYAFYLQGCPEDWQSR